MLLKPAELVIDPQDPFANDAFDRKEVVEAFVNLIGTLTGPFVMAIDSPWGTGKTTFLRMLAACLEKQDHPCLHFNAWETDFAEDPLIAFVGEMDQLIRNISGNEADKQGHLQKVKRIGGVLAKRAIPAAIKLATMGLLDLKDVDEKILADATGTLAEDAVDSYLKDKKHIDEFHEAIDLAIGIVEETGKKLPLVIIVDELDRCRPLYAIELLERIKHLFNVEKAIFVLALDKQQLGISLGAVYGQGFNANEYLRRFFDLEFRLNQIDSNKYCECLIERMALDTFFSGRDRDDRKNLQSTFRHIAWLFGFSARTQERLMALLVTAMRSTNPDHYFFPDLTVIMAAIKLFDSVAYERVTLHGASVMTWINVITIQESIRGRLSSDVRPAVMCPILAQHRDDPEISNFINEIQERISAGKATDEDHWIHGSISDRTYFRRPVIQLIAKRIDLAAQFSPHIF